MTKTIIPILVCVLLVIMFVAPVRNALNNLSRRQEVREENLVGGVSTFNPKIKEIQKILHQAGYDPGLIDGAMGDKTRDALKQLQEAHGLKVTGWIDEKTLETLYAVQKIIEGAKEAVVKEPVDPAQISAKQIQEVLRAGGFYSGPIDGKIGKQTVEAVKKFQKANGLKEDGVLGRQTREKIASTLIP